MTSLDDIQRELAAINVRLTRIEAALKPPAGVTAVPSQPPASQASRMSVVEYVMSKQPTSDVQRTLVFGSYLEEYRDLRNFGSEDIAGLFLEARVKKPANVADKIGKNIARGHMMPTGEVNGKKMWTLTITGQQVVKEGFGNG